MIYDVHSQQCLLHQDALFCGQTCLLLGILLLIDHVLLDPALFSLCFHLSLQRITLWRMPQVSIREG